MTSSQSACAAPCAMPPCRWPSASSGLITAPASLTVTIRRSTALPVSVSTSATAMCAPNGKVGPGALNTARTNSRSGSASLVSGTEAAGSPATAKALRSVSKTRSAGLASSVSAARCRATSSSSCDACCTAAPPCCRLREPPVPPPSGIRSVSPHLTVILSMGMPSSSLASIAHTVAWPCPCGEVPVRIVALPSGWTSTVAFSRGPPSSIPGPVIST